MKHNGEERLLPDKGVLFLGGHPNMTKKLRKKYPKWKYVTDDRLADCNQLNQEIVFYWTAHSSHKMMRYTYKKLPETSEIYYVTATNIPLLMQQMHIAMIQNKQNREN